MNRSLALFVALAVLVAHSFAIHVDASGTLAPPYDVAYVAFRLGNMFVNQGELVWNPGSPGFDSYPSILWVAVCAAIERLYLPINLFCQGLGVACATGTLVLVSRFHPNRIASLIAPLLLSVSGGMAAAAVAGTETALLAMLVTGAFLAFERRAPRALGVTLALAGWTCPEAWGLAAALFVLRAFERQPIDAAGEPTSRRRALAPFLVPLAALVAVTLWRYARTGSLTSSYGAELLSLRPGELAQGTGYVRDFLVSGASPLLVVFALWYLLRGRLSPTGCRALLLFALWIAVVALGGGGGPIYSEALVPALPLGLIAAQEGMITALNSTRRAVRGVAWAGFLFAIGSSGLASRWPADLGPLPLAALQERLAQPHTQPRFGYQDLLGRQGLAAELETTARLRGVGIFLRDHVEPGRSVMTPWPGSIAYLSRMVVHDLLGRVEPIEPGGRNTPWFERARIDVLASLERGSDYVVPFADLPPRVPGPHALARYWMDALDVAPEDPDRAARLTALLEDYELVTVPIRIESAQPTAEPTMHHLLRRRELALRPQLEIALEEGALVVRMRHSGHVQLADLSVVGVDSRGREWHLAPTGEFRTGRQLLTRSYLLVHSTGSRAAELVRAPLPLEEPRLQRVTAVLRTPGAPGTHSWNDASGEAVLDLR